MAPLGSPQPSSCKEARRRRCGDIVKPCRRRERAAEATLRAVLLAHRRPLLLRRWGGPLAMAPHRGATRAPLWYVVPDERGGPSQGYHMSDLLH